MGGGSLRVSAGFFSMSFCGSSERLSSFSGDGALDAGRDVGRDGGLDGGLEPGREGVLEGGSDPLEGPLMEEFLELCLDAACLTPDWVTLQQIQEILKPH